MHSTLTGFCFCFSKKKKRKRGRLCGDGGIDNWISLVINTVFPSWILLFGPFSPPWCQVIGVHRRVGGVGRKHVRLLHRGIVIKKHFSADTHTIQMRFSHTEDLFNPQRIKKTKKNYLNISSSFLITPSHCCAFVFCFLIIDVDAFHFPPSSPLKICS